MKKHIFGCPALVIFLCMLFLSCDKEEPTAQPRQEFARVIPINMPAYFEEGMSYNIEVIYELPSSCHTPYGLGIEQKGNSPEGLRHIFITGVSQLDPEASCTEDDEVDLEIQDSFFISIDQDQPYTFYFWTGVNEDNEHNFTEIQVPVRSPESER